MDLEKDYDTIDRHFMWQMLSVCEVGGKLLKAVQSFYVDSSKVYRLKGVHATRIPTKTEYSFKGL